MENEGARVFRRRGDLLHQLLGLGDQLLVFIPRFLFFLLSSPSGLRLGAPPLALGSLVRPWPPTYEIDREMSDMYAHVYIYEEILATRVKAESKELRATRRTAGEI
jgi:hypothetical protein